MLGRTVNTALYPIPVPTLRVQMSARVNTRVFIHRKVAASVSEDSERKAIRVTRCFRGNVQEPQGRYEATGEMKSATMPTDNRETVLASERSFT
jgi:hypothetical protein